MSNQNQKSEIPIAPKTEPKMEPKPEPTPEPKTAPTNPFGADPMAFWAASQQGYQKAFAEACARAHAFTAQFAQLEAQMMERAREAIASWAELTQDALAYGAQLSAEARKVATEASRRARESMGVGA